MLTTLAKIVATLCLAQVSRAEFNFTTCPAPHEVMQPKVLKEFDMEKFVGSYFELALHDYTQYPTCPDPSCVRTTKEFTDVGTGE